LDLHTTSGPGGAFVLTADTLPNRKFSLGLVAPLVLGLEERVPGTLTEHLADRGFITSVFEAGQHGDRGSVDRSEAAIWLALAAAGLVPEGHPRVTGSRTVLLNASHGLPRVLAVRYRYGISEAAEFNMKPGYENFRPVARGEVLAEYLGQPVTAPESGRLLMPLYQKLGSDGFFLVREFRPFWLKVSEMLRGLGADRAPHLLPGVTRSPSGDGAIIIDRHRARWYALEIAHLLGFRRMEERVDRIVVVRRRQPLDRGAQTRE
jgi:succinylglutamate desuccinylase